MWPIHNFITFSALFKSEFRVLTTPQKIRVPEALDDYILLQRIKHKKNARQYSLRRWSKSEALNET